jgi:Ku protein
MLEGSILGKGMLGTTLRYDYEVRDEKNLFKGIPSLRAKKDMVELASHIVDRKAGRFDPGEFKDEYELALRKLVKRKAAGHTIEPPAEPSAPANVINLMDALRESMKRRKASSSRSKSAARKKSARRKAG